MLDAKLVEKFKGFQKKTGKHLDLEIENVEFESVTLKELHQKELVSYRKPSGPDKFIEIGDIDRNSKRYDISKKIKPNLPEKAKHAPKNTILVSRVRPLLGGYTIINDDDYTFTSGDLNPIVLNEDINHEYVFMLVCSPIFRTFLKRNQDTTGQKPTITSKLYDFSVSLPKPTILHTSYEIQKAIVEFLEYRQSLSKDVRTRMHRIRSTVEKIDSVLLGKIFAMKDPFLRKKFDDWCECKRYDVSADRLAFKAKKIDGIANFPAMTRVSGKPDISIEEYNSLSTDEKNNYFALVSGTTENNQVAGYFHANKLTNNALSNPDVISWTRINGKMFFIQNKPVCTNDDSFVMKINDGFSTSFIQKALINKMANSNHSWGNKAGKTKIKELEIAIPNDLTGKYSSQELQKILEEFIKSFYHWRDKLYSLTDSITATTEKIDEAFLIQMFRRVNAD